VLRSATGRAHVKAKVAALPDADSNTSSFAAAGFLAGVASPRVPAGGRKVSPAQWPNLPIRLPASYPSGPQPAGPNPAKCHAGGSAAWTTASTSSWSNCCVYAPALSLSVSQAGAPGPLWPTARASV